MREAGIHVPAEAEDDSFLTAEDEQRLADHLIDSLGPSQTMTAKALKIQNLINYLAAE